MAYRPNNFTGRHIDGCTSCVASYDDDHITIPLMAV